MSTNDADKVAMLDEYQTDRISLLAEAALDGIAKRDASARKAEAAQKECSAAWSALVTYADSVLPVTVSSKSVVAWAMNKAKDRVTALAKSSTAAAESEKESKP